MNVKMHDRIRRGAIRIQWSSQYAMIQSEGGGVIISDIMGRGALNTKNSNQKGDYHVPAELKKTQHRGR